MGNNSSVMIYTTKDGQTRLDVTFDRETVWLTQGQMADLFQKAKSTINEHIKNIFADEELDEKVVVRKFRTTTQHGAMDKVKTEYQKYQAKTLSAVETDYLNTVKELAKKVEKK